MMIGNKVNFGEPQDITLPSEDGQSVRLPFAAVPYEVVGTVAEAASTGHYVLVVRLSRSRASSWGLDPQRGRAVMIQAAIEHVFEVFRHRDFSPSEELLINTETFPGPLPERFAQASAMPTSIEVERERGPIGFKP